MPLKAFHNRITLDEQGVRNKKVEAGSFFLSRFTIWLVIELEKKPGNPGFFSYLYVRIDPAQHQSIN